MFVGAIDKNDITITEDTQSKIDQNQLDRIEKMNRSILIALAVLVALQLFRK